MEKYCSKYCPFNTFTRHTKVVRKRITKEILIWKPIIVIKELDPAIIDNIKIDKRKRCEFFGKKNVTTIQLIQLKK